MSPSHSPVAGPVTEEALELPTFRVLLARLAASDLGRRRVEELSPFGDRRELEERRQRYEEAERLLPDGSLVPDLEVPLGPLLVAMANPEAEIGGPELLWLAQALKATGRAAERIRDAGEGAAALGALTRGLADLGELGRRISRVLDRRGKVRDAASPTLKSLRRRIHRERDALYGDLRGLIAEHGEALSEETTPLHAGRIVLLMKSGAKGRLPGLVHGRSATGRSLYFEPLRVVEANNRLQEAAAEEAAERRRIVAELVDGARSELLAIRQHFALLAELDLLQAACRLAGRCQARLPDLGEMHELKLVGARHPLLDPGLTDLRQEALGQPGHTGEVVPLDLELSPAERVLVITGPNAGGKTVALKTVGLLALVSQCGLPVPAAPGTRLPVFSRVLASVGDDQDMLADRSTFSGRLLRLKEAWRVASDDSLVLLDELGSGTDPEEGAALAVALLEGLLERRSQAVMTTHLTQLAAAAIERPGARCAAMEFDARTGRPTYHLRSGSPGGSEALALARRLGLPSAWLDRADALLGREHRDLRRLLAEVERLRGELAAEVGRAAAESERARQEADRLAAEHREMELERRRLARQLEKDLEVFKGRVRERLGAEVERLRGELEGGRRKGLAVAATERVFTDAPRLETTPDEAEAPLAEGGWARHRSLGWQGRVEKLDRRHVVVRVKGKKVRCGAEELVGLAEKPAAQRPKGRKRRSVETPETAAVGRELNLIGKRVEPALEELDTFLDRALLAGHEAVRVIHGHGSGRLRQAVREHLAGHRAVAGSRPGRNDEGGDGATVVTLTA